MPGDDKPDHASVIRVAHFQPRAGKRDELVTRHRVPVDGTVVGGAGRRAGRHRFQTRAALPLAISSRSWGSAFANIASTIAFEFGKLVTGCG